MTNFARILTRIVIGVVFVGAGFSKFQNLPGAVEFFTSLGIPAPELQAPFVALTELGCGFLVLIGLATRLASVPLIATMVVAIATAKWPDVSGYQDFLDLSEFLYIVLLVWLVAAGGGCYSVDHLIKKRATGWLKKLSSCF
jgi:putative oxidoreductase